MRFDLERSFSMATRCATNERTDFENEHDYAKHPVLALKKEKDEFCKSKIEVLTKKDKSESEDEIDVDTVEPPTNPMYNKSKVQHQFLELEKYVTTRVSFKLKYLGP